MRIRSSVLGLAAFGLGLIAFCGLTLEARKNASAAPADAEAPIRELLAKQQAAWNAGDVDAFLLGYWDSDELTFSGSGGITRGFAGVRERYKKSYPDRQAMGELDFSHLEVRELGADAALVLGQWHLKRAKGDVGGVFSLVLQRFPQGWRIIHDHTSVVAP
jgi:L-asparaginase / beta-aspartyl-peptidase